MRHKRPPARLLRKETERRANDLLMAILPIAGMVREDTAAPRRPCVWVSPFRGAGRTVPSGWGVLHELLQDETIEIAALSGTSAGAINAVVFADGWLGRPPIRGAGHALARFWHWPRPRSAVACCGPRFGIPCTAIPP